MHKNKVAQKCVLIVRSVSDRRADEVNVWGNLISMHLEPNESEHNAFEGRADSSIGFTFAATFEFHLFPLKSFLTTDINATVSSTFKRVRFRLVRFKVH